jgi:hypothetical protein
MGVPPLTIQPDGSDESRIVIRVSRVRIILSHARLAARRIAMVALHLSRLLIADHSGRMLDSHSVEYPKQRRDIDHIKCISCDLLWAPVGLTVDTRP